MSAVITTDPVEAAPVPPAMNPRTRMLLEGPIAPTLITFLALPGERIVSAEPPKPF